MESDLSNSYQSLLFHWQTVRVDFWNFIEQLAKRGCRPWGELQKTREGQSHRSDDLVASGYTWARQTSACGDLLIRFPRDSVRISGIARWPRPACPPRRLRFAWRRKFDREIGTAGHSFGRRHFRASRLTSNASPWSHLVRFEEASSSKFPYCWCIWAPAGLSSGFGWRTRKGGDLVGGIRRQNVQTCGQPGREHRDCLGVHLVHGLKSKHSTRANTSKHNSTRLNTSKHAQHDSTRLNTTQHDSTRLNMTQHNQKHSALLATSRSGN